MTLTAQSQKASIFELQVVLKILLEQEKIWLSYFYLIFAHTHGIVLGYNQKKKNIYSSNSYGALELIKGHSETN